MDKDLALIAWVLVALALPLLLGSIALATRRGAIRRPGGAVTCWLRRDDDVRWRRGVAAYRTDRLAWFPSVGVGLRPDVVVLRQSMRLTDRRLTTVADPAGLPPGLAVARFETGPRLETGPQPRTLVLAMSPDTLTGLLAWVEAAPHHWAGEGVLD